LKDPFAVYTSAVIFDLSKSQRNA